MEKAAAPPISARTAVGRESRSHARLLGSARVGWATEQSLPNGPTGPFQQGPSERRAKTAPSRLCERALPACLRCRTHGHARGTPCSKLSCRS
eukprot:10306522-Alexandrium_andersonii.AAC.1